VIAIEIEKLSEDSLCNISSPHNSRKPTDPAGSGLAHPPRQPGQILGAEYEKAEIVKVGATEAYARGISWGLMQVMGQTAREKGASSLYLSTLCDPAVGLAVGCRILRQKLEAAGGDATRALLAWNGGANRDYADEVLARVGRYR